MNDTKLKIDRCEHTCKTCYRSFHTKTGLLRHENRTHGADHDVSGMMIKRVRNVV